MILLFCIKSRPASPASLDRPFVKAVDYNLLLFLRPGKDSVLRVCPLAQYMSCMTGKTLVLSFCCKSFVAPPARLACPFFPFLDRCFLFPLRPGKSSSRVCL